MTSKAVAFFNLKRETATYLVHDHPDYDDVRLNKGDIKYIIILNVPMMRVAYEAREYYYLKSEDLSSRI